MFTLRGMLIDGAWEASGERGTVEVRSPYDDRLVAMVPAGGAGDVDRAVRAARAALDRDDFARADRAALLDRTAAALLDRVDDFARVIAAEAAKPLKTARVEATRVVDTFRFAAATARTFAGEVVPMDASASGAGKTAFVLRVPIGVVAAISPFNFPLNLVAHKIAPAIAAGCPVVLKPAHQTPVSALRLAELLTDLGLPRGWLNVVPGGGGEVGAPLTTHDDIAYITFTGSAEVGWGIAERSARKKVRLELGSNSPLIIDADADWETAAAKVAVAGFSHAGQSCISTQRIFLHDDVADMFLGTLIPKVEALRLGDPLDPDTDVSSLITSGDTERVHNWIDEAASRGAKVLCGGEVVDNVLQPTVVDGVTRDMKLQCQEVFGPVVTITRFRDFDDALAMANDSAYGLQAGVFTRDVGKALKAGRALEYGGVLINDVPTSRADQQPYGGVKDSGNTREGPAYAVEEMTERRLLVLSP
jgi:acyl-CoA reductase-like NAD-dependent aldehyde dehydrogenase